MTEYQMSNLGSMSDRVGIMLKDDRATIGRRMLHEIIFVPDQNDFRLSRKLQRKRRSKEKSHEQTEGNDNEQQLHHKIREEQHFLRATQACANISANLRRIASSEHTTSKTLNSLMCAKNRHIPLTMI
jgi:hypothetical protein